MIYEYKEINEKLFCEKTYNGLPVYILNRKGINAFYMAILVNFGATDLNYQNIKSGKNYSVIKGTAHFLEHKLFESKDENIFEIFSKHSASVNAYTNLTSTVYFFCCTDKIEANINTLLKLIQNPYITDENVEKEKEIISQEIKMYNDNPYWTAYNNFLTGIYNYNNAKYDVAGEINDIRNISKVNLLTCYQDFYVSDNMAVFIIGDVISEDIFKYVETSWSLKPDIQKIKRLYQTEPEKIVRDNIIKKFEINEKLFVMGFKENSEYVKAENIIFKEIIQKIVFEYLLGSASPIYEKLYNENYIDNTIGYGTNISKQYFFNIISGSSNNPEYVKEKLLEELERLKNGELDHNAFENIIKMLTGSYIKSLDDENTLLNNIIQYANNGNIFFDILKTFNRIKIDDVVNELQYTFKPENLCLSIVTA